MTPIVFLMMLVVSRAAAEVVELSCSDNATCIDGLAKEFVRSIREQKTVRLFDVLTIEPLQRRQARSSQGLLSRFLSGHAFSFDWNDFQFRLSRPEQRSDAMELEVFESRGARDLAEPVPKKTGTVGTTKDAGEEEKRPKRLKGNRRQRKKVLQALIPMMFGMKSAGTVMFAMAVVTALTLKAFVASKLALMVTVGMALKRLYESYGNGVGLQNHPYLYSQYPIDFPSASSHAYSVSGVSPNFASPEMYNPTALSAHPHAHEMLQQGDASAQQSQQQPTLQLVNNTRATERWDGKSTLQKFLEPIADGIRSIIDPIASVFFDAMPATFRGMSSDVTTATSDEPIESASTLVEEKVKKPREILVPQPRNIAQRKTTNARKRGLRQRPKKYTELKVDLDKLKRNKDFHDYIKTKKYRYNYPDTFYYPRVKHFVNPDSFIVKPNNRLSHYSYNQESSPVNATAFSTYIETSQTELPPLFSYNTDDSSDWKPIITTEKTSPIKVNSSRPHKRSKRHAISNDNGQSRYNRNGSLSYPALNNDIQSARGASHYSWFTGWFGFFDFLFESSPVQEFFKGAKKITKKLMKSHIKVKPSPGPPKYYLLTYDFVMFSLSVLDDYIQFKTTLMEHLTGGHKSHKPKHKKKLKIKPSAKPELSFKNETSIEDTESEKKYESVLLNQTESEPILETTTYTTSNLDTTVLYDLNNTETQSLIELTTENPPELKISSINKSDTDIATEKKNK